MDVSGYTGAEVGDRFGISAEAVRLAGQRGDLPRINVKPGAKRAAWRYPAAAIDALDRWPAARRGPRPRDPGELDQLRAEFAGVRRELQQERVGRGVAETRIVELEVELDKVRAALLVFVDPDGDVARRRADKRC